MRLQYVEADWKFDIGWIHQDHVFHPVFGNAAQNLVDQIAMRIEHGQTSAIRDVLPDQIQQQR